MVSHLSSLSWNGSNGSNTFCNNCTGPTLYNPYSRKSAIVTPANVQNGQQNYGRLPDKLAGEISWNKLCLYLIGSYKIFRKVKKADLLLKSVKMINPITGWFEIT